MLRDRAPALSRTPSHYPAGVKVPDHPGPRRLGTGGLLVAAVLLAMLPLVVRRVGDADYWWHIVTARWMVGHGAVPVHDLYTYTVARHVWTDHEYLSELLMYGLGRVGGQGLVSIGFGVITWAGFLLILLRISLRPTPRVVTAAALGLAVVAGVSVWGPRPQMITFALVCLELYVLERFLSGGRRVLYVLPPLVTVWANFHGGFVIAFLFLAVTLLVEGTRFVIHRGDLPTRGRVLRLLAVSGACAVGGLLNPHGAAIYTYSWRTQTSAVQQSFISEWQSPDFHALQMRGLEAMLLLIIGLAIRQLRVRPFGLLCAVVGLVLALQSVRHIAIFVAAATPQLAWAWGPSVASLGSTRAAQVLRLRLRSRAAVNSALVATVLVGAGSLATVRVLLAHQAASTVANYPSGAAGYLQAHPALGSRMFSDYAWGGYMIYRFYPQPNRRVFLFGEADLMGDAIMNEYVDVVGLHSNWLDVLNSHGVDYVVFEPNTPLATALATQQDWHLVYSDHVALIYVRHKT